MFTVIDLMHGTMLHWVYIELVLQLYTALAAWSSLHYSICDTDAGFGASSVRECLSCRTTGDSEVPGDTLAHEVG